ncbi:MAG: L,D-transpeptidase, partial [Synergistaceae bacterium]|nr:L,D-transpeptidase [Synergistaceae bacterium]
IDIKETVSSDSSSDAQIDSGSWIIPIEIPSRFKSPDERDLPERDLLQKDMTSTFRFEQFPPIDFGNVAGRRKWNQWILIDKGNYRLTLYNREIVLHEWNIAVGIEAGDKQRVGDNRTPNGTFSISQIQDSSKWAHDFGDGKGVIQEAYGPWFIRLNTPPWTGIGIHGTHDSDSIGYSASEGCIRMSNEDISELKEMVWVGMPVVIVERTRAVFPTRIIY